MYRIIALLIVVLGLTGVRLIVAATAELADDEAYYRLWGLAPALSYYDHPPMVGWWSWLGSAIAGDTRFGIRLLSPISLAVGSLMLWRLGDILYGRSTAAVAVLMFNAMPLIAAGAVLLTPDPPTALFWGLAIWALAEHVRSERPVWWLAVGLFAGLALLSKYSSLFLGAGIVAWLMVSGRWHRALTSWQLWAGGVLAVALFSPVLLWNDQHDWASFAKQFSRAVPDRAFTLRYLAELIGGQIALLNPLLVPFVVWGFAASLRQGWRRGDAALLMIPATSLPFIAYMLFHALHDRVQANWLAPLYPGLALLAAWAATRTAQWGARIRRPARVLATSAVVLGLGASLALYAYVSAVGAGSFAGRGPIARMLGWEALAEELKDIAARQDAGWIATAKHQTTGQLAWFLGDDLPVVQLTERIRYVHLPPPPPERLARPGLYIEVVGRSAVERNLRQRFQDVRPLGTIPRASGGREIERYEIWRVDRAIGDPLEPP